jgi:glycosyltransferase involved in cell wall biosynthesis
LAVESSSTSTFADAQGPLAAQSEAPTIDVKLLDRSLDELSGNRVKAPPVSVVVINFNYAAFIPDAIQSIRSQDYPHLEVVVVDNASTDNSDQVITSQIAGDPRFKHVRLERNEFAMAAAMQGLAATTAPFVCFVDADDFLFKNYISTHVQAHLALPRGVAFTSSNIVEIDTSGAILSSGRKEFLPNVNADKRGLRSAAAVSRLATITDDDFGRLSEAVVTLSQTKSGWLWSPGTANLYRRSVLEFVKPRIRSADTSILSADGYFARFAHWMAGSALIDIPLSAYRIHGHNVFVKSPSVIGIKGGAGEAVAWVARRRRYLLASVLERASEIAAITSPDRFWVILDQALDALAAGETTRDEPVQSLFVDSFPTLVRTFTLPVVIAELRKRMRRGDLLRIAERAYPDGTEPVIRSLLVRAEFLHYLRRLSRR